MFSEHKKPELIEFCDGMTKLDQSIKTFSLLERSAELCIL